MALEDFKTDKVDSDDTNVVDHSMQNEETPDRISHLISELETSGNDSESEKHYNSKLRAAITLAQNGYYVYIEHTMSDGSIADVYAELDKDEAGIGYNTIICEVGHYTASRAKQAISESDCVILVPKGSNIDDGVVLNDEDLSISSESGIHASFVDEFDNEVYIDSKGDYFIPSIDNIYVKKFRIIASHMLSAFNDVQDMTVEDIVAEVNDESDKQYKDVEIEKVARELGFLNDY